MKNNNLTKTHSCFFYLFLGIFLLGSFKSFAQFQNPDCPASWPAFTNCNKVINGDLAVVTNSSGTFCWVACGWRSNTSFNAQVWTAGSNHYGRLHNSYDYDLQTQYAVIPAAQVEVESNKIYYLSIDLFNDLGNDPNAIYFEASDSIIILLANSTDPYYTECNSADIDLANLTKQVIYSGSTSHLAATVETFSTIFRSNDNYDRVLFYGYEVPSNPDLFPFQRFDFDNLEIMEVYNAGQDLYIPGTTIQSFQLGNPGEGCSLSSGVGVNYSYSPTTNLTDPNNPVTWAQKHCSIREYILTISHTNHNITYVVKDTVNISYQYPISCEGGPGGSGLVKNAETQYYNRKIEGEDGIVEITLFPNPTSNKVFFEFSNNLENVNIEIYNSLGEKVKEEEILNNSIDLGHLDNGIYFYNIFNSHGILKSGKIQLVD